MLMAILVVWLLHNAGDNQWFPVAVPGGPNQITVQLSDELQGYLLGANRFGSVLDLLIFLSIHGIDTPRQVRRHGRMVQLREVLYGIRTDSLSDMSWCRCGEIWQNG